jgi:hypothetical protein
MLCELRQRRDQARSREEYDYFDKTLRYEQEKMMMMAPMHWSEQTMYWNDPLSSKTVVSATVGGDRVFDKKLLLTTKGTTA